MFRFLGNLIRLLVTSGLLAAVIYLCSDAFTQRWRSFVVEELAERGLHLDFKRLSLSPFGGMVAADVRIYNDAQRERVLANVDHLNLEFDLGKLFERKVSIEELELKRANLALPVNPEREEEGVLELKDLNARVFLREGRLEVQQAEGMLSGIRLNVVGDLVLAPNKKDDKKKSDLKLPLESLQVLQEQRGRIRKGLEWLHRFQFATPPRLNLEVHAEAERPLETSARLFFEVQQLSYEGYVCKELSAEAEFSAGIIDLTRLHLKDRTGEVNASATWKVGADDLRFHFTSSADLPGLAQAFLNSDNLREIVFYDSPHLALDGVWYVGGPLATYKRPVNVTGRLECGRFSSRGAMFEGLSAQIGVAPEGVYIRDALLKHSTGTLKAQVLNHETNGCRYRLVLGMDPNAFLPFSRQEQTRQIIRRFQFSPKSKIHLELEGTGDELDFQECLNRGHGLVERFRYKGVEIESLEADVEFKGHSQKYSNVKIQRVDGVAEADLVDLNTDEDWVRLHGVKTRLDPVPILRCFASKVADNVTKYRFQSTTRVEMDGAIYWREDEKSDFTVKFRDPEGSAHYQALGQDFAISAPTGDLHFKGETMSFDISGRVLGDSMTAKGKVELAPGSDDYSLRLKLGKFTYPVFKKNMPFTEVVADISEKSKITQYDFKADLMGGKFSMKGTLSDKGKPNSYQGEMQLEDVSLERFAQIYSQSNDTEGDLTGHFKFAGQLDKPASLKGNGVAFILNGDLYSVPILGPLTPMLGAILPKQIKGYNIAKEANCTFEVADGFVVTRDFEALTSTFRILLDGRIDFIRDELDITAQVRVRGLPGLVFLPFSELLEYRASGTTMNPKWTPNLLKGGNNSSQKTGNRAVPSAERLKTAEKVGEGAGAVQPVPTPETKETKRPMIPLFKRPSGR